MNKAYFIIPLIGVSIFFGFYHNFSKGHDAHLAEIKAKAENEKKEKAKKQIAEREEAIRKAVEASAIRAKERAEKEKIEEEKKIARQDAEDKRLRANSDKNKRTDEVRRYKKDLEEVQEEIKKSELEKKNLQEEQVSLKIIVKQAEANVNYYHELLDKIALAEKARADAAAAAAAAAKKS